MVYVGQTRSRKLIDELAALGFGECTQPREYPPRRQPWFLDNAAFSDWKAGRDFDDERFVVAMDRAREGECAPDFVVVPDRVAHPDSLAFSRSWLPICRGSLPGVPCYLAVQDGMATESETIAGFDGVFVGGTKEWKASTGAAWVELAHSAGVRCHVGRAGTPHWVRWARTIGADSIDSCTPLWAEANLRRFVLALGVDLDQQMELFA